MKPSSTVPEAQEISAISETNKQVLPAGNSKDDLSASSNPFGGFTQLPSASHYGITPTLKAPFLGGVNQALSKDTQGQSRKPLLFPTISVEKNGSTQRTEKAPLFPVQPSLLTPSTSTFLSNPIGQNTTALPSIPLSHFQTEQAPSTLDSHPSATQATQFPTTLFPSLQTTSTSEPNIPTFVSSSQPSVLSIQDQPVAATQLRQPSSTLSVPTLQQHASAPSPLFQLTSPATKDSGTLIPSPAQTNVLFPQYNQRTVNQNDALPSGSHTPSASPPTQPAPFVPSLKQHLSSRSRRLDSLAETFFLEERGLFDQFIECEVGDIVKEAVKQVKRERQDQKVGRWFIRRVNWLSNSF